MVNQYDEVSSSPLKKLKILSEKQLNVQNVTQSNQCIKATQDNNILFEEPLLLESKNKYVIFPINNEDMWHMYKDLVGNFWSVTETIHQLEKLKLDTDEMHYIKFYSSIFASPKSEGYVIENFAEELCELIQVTEAKFFYGHQLMVQNIHFEMYNKLLDYCSLNMEEKHRMFKIVESYDAIINKRVWINQWVNSPFSHKIMASAIMHGIMFTSLETTRDWLKTKSRNSLNDLVDIFDRMIIDQSLQRDFSCLMFNHLKNKPTKEKILESINEAARIEFNFLYDGLKSEMINITGEDLIQYIDRNSRILKKKLLFTEKNTSTYTNTKSNENISNNLFISKSNSQKLVFDEDF